MAINKLTDDLDIISKLGDSPNLDNNLNADELKAKFDESGKIIQQFINDVIVPAVNKKVDNDGGYVSDVLVIPGIHTTEDGTICKGAKVVAVKANGKNDILFIPDDGDSVSINPSPGGEITSYKFTITKPNGSKQEVTIEGGKPGKSAYAYAQEAGYTGTEADFARELASVDLPCVDARSADFDMDAIFASGRHCVIYQTNGNTLGTPYKYGKTNLVAAMILSYSNSESHGFQLALPNGGERMYTRKRLSGVTGEWTAIPNTTDLAKKLDINQGTANAGKVMLIDGEGKLVPREVGMVETFVYGEGTFAAIEKACAAGSWNVTCLKDGIPYLLSSCDETGATFRRVGDGCIEEVSVDAQDNWTSAQVNLQTESDICIVDYGTKAVGTYTDINQALQAGKAVFCRNGQKLYPLSMADTSMAIFNGTGGDYFEELAFVDYEWTTSQFLKTTVVSKDSNHRSYPTAKAVYDYVQKAIAEAMGTS